MNIDFFIFNWKYAPHATRLEAVLRPFGRVVVINSDPACAGRGWVDLGDDAYFAAQWNAALSRCSPTADVMFHVQADAFANELPRIIDRAAALFDRFHWGVFAPNVDYTWHVARTDELEPGVWTVPLTDSTCWALHRDVVAMGPNSFPGRYGWGIDWTYCELSRALGRPVIRDYTFTVDHPRQRNYSDSSAEPEYKRLAAALRKYLEAIPASARPSQRFVVEDYLDGSLIARVAGRLPWRARS
jgi:hypothetical protein